MWVPTFVTNFLCDHFRCPHLYTKVGASETLGFMEPKKKERERERERKKEILLEF